MLRDPAFLPAFTAAWGPVAATCPAVPADTPHWWETAAKPFIRDFCRSFSLLLAAKRHQSRFFTAGISNALAAKDWATVEACRRQIRSLDAWPAAGVALRAHAMLVEEEEAGAFHLATKARHGRSPGLQAVKSAATGANISDAAGVEAEVLGFYSAIFQGRHAAAADASDPVDSGTPFSPDPDTFPRFLEGLPRLSPAQRDSLETPFSMPELAATVQEAAPDKSPGLDGLFYEFYHITLPLVGPPLLTALNAMLAEGLLTLSLCRGVVHLLPKVTAVPTAAQLRPITLLAVDYKLLTKMLVARLLHVLPDVLKASQLCSVHGRSIFDGAAAILSLSEYLHRRNLPGFLLSLDFFHAFDRVSLQWLDRVLEAMSFGLVLRQWVATLHRRATACFMLHSLSPDQEVEFSIRQGDPAASVFFTIYIEPFLACLERFLRGLFMGGLRKATLSYMDDVNELGEDEQDILVTDELCRAFEAASGAILNRNRKTVILGLGSWAGRRDWPLPWLQAVDQAKVFGVTYTPVFNSTVSVSWDRVAAGVERVLQMWSARRLPTLRQRSLAVETFALSKAYTLPKSCPSPRPRRLPPSGRWGLSLAGSL